MPTNRGNTSLKRRRRSGDGMKDFDRLSPRLRTWLASAMLPWRPRSVERTYAKVFARTQSADQALQELDRIQKSLIARDGRKVWGEDYPTA